MNRRPFVPLLRGLGFAAALAAGTPAAGQGAGSQGIDRITLDEFKKAFDAGRVIALDVRDADSYAAGHIPGALLFPLREVPQQAVLLKGTKKLIVAYCA